MPHSARPGGPAPRAFRVAALLVLPIACLIGAAGPARAMPAHPDLLRQVGPGRAAVLHARAVDLQEVAQLRLPAAEKAAARLAGNGTALVILWEFADHAADRVAHPSGAYHDLLFSEGVLPAGSMNDFYLENSYGAFGVQGGVSGWTIATRTYASYALPGGAQSFTTCRNMIIDAIAQLDPAVDFGLYDNDGPDGVPDSPDDDGFVDALFFIHAGPGQEQTGNTADIWSHASGFTNGLATNDGVRIYRYSVEPEELAGGALMTVGVFCHEYGHVLGLPDLYDTDYSSGGIGEWGLMSGGSWNHRAGEQPGSRPAHLTAWCKKEMGWLTPINVTGSLSGVSIPPAETNPVAYRIWRDGVVGPEYFLVENRRRIGFDQGLVRRQILNGLPAPEGLVIYHVDEGVATNSYDRHRLVDVVEATPWQAADGSLREHLDGELTAGPARGLANNNRGDNGDLWPGFLAFSADSTDWSAPRSLKRFADDTTPSAKDYFCDPTGVAIANITLSGSNVLADFSLQPAAKSLPLAVGTAVFDFEEGADGWQFCRSWVHHDTTQRGDCSGRGGLWFGVTNPAWPCPSGYGNDWQDVTWRTLSVAAGATVTIRHRYALEADYDYAHLEARCAGDPGAPWLTIATYNGESTCRTDTYAIPAGIFAGCPAQGGSTPIDLRLRMTSDGGWSSQDGSYCGVGWWVDQVSVQNVITGVGEPPAPLAAVLLEPAPNPFNPSTTLRFNVPADARSLSLTVHDQRGRLVRTVMAQQAPAAGWGEAVWDGRDDAGRRQPSGVYFARLAVDDATSVRKLALVK